MREQFRLAWFTYAAVALLVLVFLVSPAQFPVVLHKLALVSLGGVLGYWLDRHLFPDARVGRYSSDYWMLRRAIVVAACVLSIGLAL